MLIDLLEARQSSVAASALAPPPSPPPDMFRPHLSQHPTLLDALFRTLRASLGAHTDPTRALVASVLFLFLFSAILFTPPSAVAALPLALYGCTTWGLLMVLEWDGPSYSHGTRVGRLPQYLLGLTNAFALLSLLRLGGHALLVCTTWRGDWAAMGENWPSYSIRVMAGVVLAVGTALMHVASKSLRKGASLPPLPSIRAGADQKQAQEYRTTQPRSGPRDV
ncbi:hypothetical protein CALVIDRAFT_533754 [Calocera viscosa TUFC12733]|uniref:Uncharacterized protein n=1 Tax=Calocera viscosa (strain TUFC12733) TaxID=1330018 RepID=A0A167QNG4_CALVF|nr:hypothetical protein CALVIDRAFT_533754 [Calocera viscosa TUFC12733]